MNAGTEAMPPWGRIVVAEAETDPRGRPRQRHAFLPGCDLAEHLPRGFRFELDALFLPDSGRAFVSTGPLDEFVSRAWLLGEAVRSAAGTLTSDAIFTSRLHRLIFRWQERVHQRFTDRLRRTDDLRLSIPERPDADRRDVLPVDLGLPPGTQGKRWSVDEFLREGRRLADERGMEAPSEHDVIRLGFFAAGRTGPFDLEAMPPEKVTALVRLCLFEPAPCSSKIKSEVRELVAARLCELLEQHIDDETERFNRWIDSSSDVIHAIAKRRRGGVIERDAARRVVLDLIWDAYRWAADSIHAAMRVFANTLSQPLNASEEQLYHLNFRRHSWLGNLPLIMIMPRLTAAPEALQHLQEEPGDSVRQGTLLRTLHLQREAMSNRREADRTWKKNRRPTAGGEGEVTVRCSPLQPTDTDGSGSESLAENWNEVVSVFCEQSGVRCNCNASEWEAGPPSGDRETQISVDIRCLRCEREEKIPTTLAVLQGIAASVTS